MAIVKSMRKLPSRIAREVKVGVSDRLLGPFESGRIGSSSKADHGEANEREEKTRNAMGQRGSHKSKAMRNNLLLLSWRNLRRAHFSVLIGHLLLHSDLHAPAREPSRGRMGRLV